MHPRNTSGKLQRMLLKSESPPPCGCFVPQQIVVDNLIRIYLIHIFPVNTEYKVLHLDKPEITGDLKIVDPAVFVKELFIADCNDITIPKPQIIITIAIFSTNMVQISM